MSTVANPENKFTYIQVEASDISTTFFRFDERTSDAVITDSQIINADFLFAHQVGATLASTLARVADEKRKLIIGLHSGICSTIQTAITIRRPQPQKIIDEPELESLISSAIWKAITGSQSEVAAKVNVSGPGLVPVSASVLKIRVDGHRVATPIGFPAHTIEITLIYTVIPRVLFETLTPLFFAERESYITEIGMSDLLQITSRKKEDEAILVRVSEKYTYVYHAKEDEKRYLDTIYWGRGSLLGALTNTLMISERQALELLRRAEDGLTSSYVTKKINALLLEEAAVLLKAVGVYARKASKVYIESSFSLPEDILKADIAAKAGVSVPILVMPSNPHGGKAKSALSLRMKSSAPTIAMLCANAAAAIRFFEQSDIQKIAKRRARWLASSSVK